MPPVIASIVPNKGQTATDLSNAFTLTVRGSGFTADSKVNFGGASPTTTFLDSNTLLAKVTGDMYSAFSLGGITVAVQDGTQTSNITTFEVSSQSPITVGDLAAVTDAISIPNIDNILNTPSEYIEAVPYVQVYRIKSGDTIYGIAQRKLGDTSKWADIAFINNLRYPFISEDDRTLRGQLNYNVVLTRRLNAGDSTVYVNGTSTFLSKGAILFFVVENVLSNGQLRTISDIVVVDEIVADNEVPANTKIRLESPVFNTYDAGTEVDVLSTNNNTTSRVVTIGDFVLIPSSTPSDSFVQSQSIDASQAYQMLGADIALNKQGLLYADDNGDLRTVIGLDNLHQAISHRLATEPNELDYHPSYGNPLLEYIGHVNTPALMVLSNFEIERTLLSDPRVNAIRDIKTSSLGDTLNVRVLVDVDIFNTSTEFNFVIPAK